MNTTVLTAIARNGAAQRAVLLALATVVLIATDERILVPVAVSIYAIANAVAIVRATARATSGGAR
ncbi:hypothetical protein [Nocardia stercoris]|uniref:Uncharacterized protein n=1 Tax=Nocardia stercoris TaxID=2483361 RepID=A0A3M2KSX8_9NOCA|nr:hypothetical protein [Nocardia stercoris]RMI28549.1 hypothetical protein EBN03_29485 [Nocardia stercoris]